KLFNHYTDILATLPHLENAIITNMKPHYTESDYLHFLKMLSVKKYYKELSVNLFCIKAEGTLEILPHFQNLRVLKLLLNPESVKTCGYEIFELLTKIRSLHSLQLHFK